MHKQGGFIKTWKKRWFELQTSGIVSYYNSPNDDYPIARFNSLQYTEIKCKSWGKSEQKKYGIKMYTPHRDWKFLCTDDAYRKSWIDAFKNVRDNVNAQ